MNGQISLIETLSNQSLASAIRNRRGSEFMDTATILFNMHKDIARERKKYKYDKTERILAVEKILNNAGKSLQSLKNENGMQLVNAGDAKKLIFQTIPVLYLYPEGSFVSYSQEDSVLANDALTMRLPQFINLLTPNIGDPYASLNTGDEIPFVKPVALTGSYIDYAIELFKLDPIGIGVNELVELPYDKIVAVMETMTSSLSAYIPDYIANKWAQPTSDIATLKNNYLFYTTSGTEKRLAETKGYVGNVKKISLDDLRKIKKAFLKNNVTGAIHGLITPEQLKDFQDLLTATSNAFYRNTGKEVEAYDQSFSIGKEITVNFEGIILHSRQSLQGANIYYKQAAGVYTKQNYGEVIDNTAVSAAMFWSEEWVRRATQAPKTFILNNIPSTYGSNISMTARVGATRWREDFLGVVMLAEAPTT